MEDQRTKRLVVPAERQPSQRYQTIHLPRPKRCEMTLARPDRVRDVGTEMGTLGTAREATPVVKRTRTSAGIAVDDELNPASGKAVCSSSIVAVSSSGGDGFCFGCWAGVENFASPQRFQKANSTETEVANR